MHAHEPLETTERPTISVITPCYNSGLYIRATIESVLAQTYAPLEMIVVDDGSTDNSAEIIAEFGSPVRLVRQPNQGESVARNVGIQAAKGDYLAFLDSDDLLLPTSYERLMEAALRTPGAAAYMGCAWFDSDPDRPYKVVPASFDAFLPAVFRTNLAPIHCWLVPRRVVQDAGAFYGQMKYFEDWDMWARVALAGTPLEKIDLPGALYRHHEKSQLATVTKPDRALGHAAIMERMCNQVLKHDEILQQHGEMLFWCSWGALHTARKLDVSWQDLKGLARALSNLASHGPPALRKSTFAKLVRLIGTRQAMALQALVPGGNKASATSSPVSL